MLQDRTDGDLTRLSDVTQAFVQAARARPEIASINTGLRTTVPQFRVDLDTDKAQTLGVPVTDVYSALQTFLGGLYVNDFNRFGRTWRVVMYARAPICPPSRGPALVPRRAPPRAISPVSTVAGSPAGACPGDLSA